MTLQVEFVWMAVVYRILPPSKLYLRSSIRKNEADETLVRRRHLSFPAQELRRPHWLATASPPRARRRKPMSARSALGRIGTPEDIADVVVWLCTDEARFITGQSILVDGGFTIPGPR